MDYKIPDALFKTIATIEDIDELLELKKNYRNARYAPDARLAIDDRILCLRKQAINN